MLKSLALTGLVLGVLLVTSVAFAQYPGYGCLQQGSLEVCMTQLSSERLAQLFPDNPGAPDLLANPWHRFMVSVMTQDDSVEMFKVVLVYEVNGERRTVAQAVDRWRDARGPWTSAAFYTAPGARFISLRVIALLPVDALEI